uniref:Uncharacterized protein n=1 Tax=Clostridium botulinum TaxID=1491 RepID=A0A126I608_CLOBO|nr:hypothetical protein [Clostridium botulinum]
MLDIIFFIKSHNIFLCFNFFTSFLFIMHQPTFIFLCIIKRTQLKKETTYKNLYYINNKLSLILKYIKNKRKVM